MTLFEDVTPSALDILISGRICNMLKQFSKVVAIFFAVLAITGCVQYDTESYAIAKSTGLYLADEMLQYSENSSVETESYESPEETTIRGSRIDFLVFASLDEFLYAYVAAREGRVFSDSQPDWITEHVDLASLETIRLLAKPMGAYRIIEIAVHGEWVNILYANIGEDDTEEARLNAIRNDEVFHFSFSRWTYEDLESWGASSPLDGVMRQDGATERDLIDGKYFLSQSSTTNWLFWAEGSNRLMLTMPRTSRANRDTSGIASEEGGLPADPTVYDMLHFTNTVTLDLQNQANIAAWSAGDFTMVEELLESSR